MRLSKIVPILVKCIYLSIVTFYQNAWQTSDKRICNFKSKRQISIIIWIKELTLFEVHPFQNWDTSYIYFLLHSFPIQTFLLENESDLTLHYFDKRDTMWWAFIQEDPHCWMKMRAGAVNLNVNITTIRFYWWTIYTHTFNFKLLIN